MNCTNCGAAMQPVGNRNYFRCPYCHTFAFPEETGDGVAVVGGETPDACPVCSGHLTRGAIDGYDVSYCLNCRGFLANNAKFNRIVQLERAKHGSPDFVPLPFSPDELKRRINCPRCHKPMDTHPYHAGGNAVIDTCERCHLIWLDAGELAVIGQYPGHGGTTAEWAGLTDPVPERVSDSTAFDLFRFRIKRW